MKLAIVYTVIVALMVLYLIFGHNGMLKYNEMVAIQKQYEVQIKQMDEQIAFLNREVELLKQDNSYLEYVIRRDLGLQKENEEQYVLPK